MAEAHEARQRDGGDEVGHSIVDQSTFRNTQIGVGYQHKSVVRQRTGKEEVATADQDKIVDKTPEAMQARKARKRQRQDQGKLGDWQDPAATKEHPNPLAREVDPATDSSRDAKKKHKKKDKDKKHGIMKLHMI